MPVIHPLYENENLPDSSGKFPITALLAGAILAFVVVMVIASSGGESVRRAEEVEG